MTFGLKAVIAAGAICALAGSALAQEYRAVITNGGQMKLLWNAQNVLPIRYGLYYDNWNELRGFVDEGLQADGSYQQTAPLVGSGTMRINTTVTMIGATARFVIRAVPSRNLTANSSHVSMRFDDAFWADSLFTADTWSCTFPRRLDQTVTSSGLYSRTYRVTNPNGLALTAVFSSSGIFGLRDGRVYNAGFELRASHTAGTWAAGVAKTYQFDVSTNLPMPIGPDAPVTVAPTSEWVPLDHQLSILTGSALDWQLPNIPPAGSNGWIRASADGQFYAQNNPSTPIRFFGTTLSGSAIFLDSATVDYIADQLAKLGYNIVRLHHFDSTLVSGSPDSTTLNTFFLNRFHYLIDALRRKGLYVAIDLCSMRTPLDNEILPGTVNLTEYKLLTLCNAQAKQNLLTFTRNLMNSTSPHTGRKLKEEPAIAWLNIVNEQTPLVYPRGSLRSEVFDQLEAATGRPWSVTTDLDAQTVDQLQGDLYDWMKGQLVADGVQALCTNINEGLENAFVKARSRMDYQATHVYYAHPAWLQQEWMLPYSQTATPPLKNIAWYGRFAASRVHNKALMVEESDAVAPNPYRGEWGLFMGAMAAVQKWNGVCRFGYTDRIQYLQSLYPTMWLITVTDPAAMATERAVGALFGRSHLVVNDATTTIYRPNPQGLADNRNVPLVKNGVLNKPFSVSNSVGTDAPATPILDGISRRADGSVVSDLFQQTMQVVTAKTCGLINNPTTSSKTAGMLTATIQGSRASLWISAVDDLPLISSRRMLLVHLTEVQNTGTTWANYERSIVTSMGTLPHLARDGSAQITLYIPNGASARVYRLDGSGRRINQVSASWNGKASKLTFTATTRNPYDGKATLYYEIVK